MYGQRTTKLSRRIRDHQIIGRLYTANPTNQELYCLRLLLLRKPGARSFNFLKTVDGVTHNTFKDAALSLNLIHNDVEFRRTILEAVEINMSKQLRNLFAVCCVFNTPTNAVAVWEEFRVYFIEDFLQTYDENIAIALALKNIQELQRNSLSLSHFNLPNYDDVLLEQFDENFIITTLDNIDNLVNVVKSVDLLNIGQRQINNDVLNFIITNNAKRLIVIDAPGGTEKLSF